MVQINDCIIKIHQKTSQFLVRSRIIFMCCIILMCFSCYRTINLQEGQFIGDFLPLMQQIYVIDVFLSHRYTNLCYAPSRVVTCENVNYSFLHFPHTPEKLIQKKKKKKKIGRAHD
eukprot:TRINITY_DN67233_c0_g1_i1.p2 TRINITY_DN67233_c0_g1~~TRINITY_DN67233_c0_g1_i1.p2  ORF type:complete len:116 (+),score=1.94 TRINITY_DN67233_c0_g1_i1:52-399(+)